MSSATLAPTQDASTPTLDAVEELVPLEGMSLAQIENWEEEFCIPEDVDPQRTTIYGAIPWSAEGIAAALAKENAVGTEQAASRPNVQIVSTASEPCVTAHHSPVATLSRVSPSLELDFARRYASMDLTALDSQLSKALVAIEDNIGSYTPQSRRMRSKKLPRSTKLLKSTAGSFSTPTITPTLKSFRFLTTSTSSKPTSTKSQHKHKSHEVPVTTATSSEEAVVVQNSGLVSPRSSQQPLHTQQPPTIESLPSYDRHQHHLHQEEGASKDTLSSSSSSSSDLSTTSSNCWSSGIHTHTHTVTHTHTHTHIYVYMHTYIHTHIYMHTYIYTHTYISTHTYIYIYISTIHIHPHTHTHTHTLSSLSHLSPLLTLMLMCVNYR